MNNPSAGTQQTRLKGDGRTIHSIFSGVLHAAHIEIAATSAIGNLGTQSLLWYMDFSLTTSFQEGMNEAFRKQLRLFYEAGGRNIVACIPDTVKNCRILRTALASAAMSTRVNAQQATKGEDAKTLLANPSLR